MAQRSTDVSVDRNVPVRRRGLRFARRVHGLRTVGLGLGFFCVAAVLYENGASPGIWGALVIHGFVWPHIAYAIARRSAHPMRAERRNLMVDSVAGGVWVAVMEFNLVPSALLVVMLSMDKVSAGGGRLLARTGLALLVACLLTAAMLGFPFRPETSLRTMVACLPFLAVYPITIAYVTFSLAQRVTSQNRKLAELSRVDPLTGLLNRQHWQQAVELELHRFHRNRRPCSLLLIDIDDFKPINDCYGHPTGDEVLTAIAGAIRDSVRAVDVAGRYGGDEFAVLLIDTEIDGALRVAERIRGRVEEVSIATLGARVCTVSIGVQQATPGTDDARDWIAGADTMLYVAKSRGRNLVSGSAAAASVS